MLLLIWAANCSAQITIFNINNGDVTALKSAITAGNTDSHTDIINLANNGTYTLTTVDNPTDGGNGLPVIKAEAGRSVIINGNGATIQRSTAGGTPNFRILEMAGGVVSLNNLTISEGYVVLPVGVAAGGGGGIYNSNGSLTLSACTFKVNGAVGGMGADGSFAGADGYPGGTGFGGAVYSSGGSVSATACVFNADFAIGGNGGGSYSAFSGEGGEGGDGDGGGIGGFGTLTLTNCIFTNCFSFGGSGGGGGQRNGGPGLGNGGGVYNGSNLTMTACSFVTCSSSYGGGLMNEVAAAASLSQCAFTQDTGVWGGGAIDNNGTLTLTRSTLTGNTIPAPNEGGGLYNFGPATISDSTFYGNSASDGGAIINQFTTLAVTGCTFVSNSAVGGANEFIAGGGAINNQDTLTVTNCTFCLNTSATDGGAICNGQGTFSGNGAILGLLNSTFSGNTATGQGGGIFFSGYGPTSYGTLANSIFLTGNHGANIANGGAGIITSSGHNISNDAGGGFLTGTGDLVNTNPLLLTATPADNGGPTRTISLFFTSPAIGHAGPGAPYRDQRGYFRNSPADIGALEYSGPLVGRCSIARSGNDIVVSTEVIGGHSYRLRRRLTIGGSWQDIPGVPDLVATGNDIESITDPGAVSLGAAFYRLDFEN